MKRNGIKPVALAAAVCLLALLCVGCAGKKTALDESGFTAAMEDAGLRVSDTTGDYSADTVTAACVAENEDYEIDFYIFVSADDAAGVFSTSRAAFESMKGNVSSDASADMGNYSMYAQTTTERYYYLCRVENTLVYVVADKAYKEDISGLIETLGY